MLGAHLEPLLRYGQSTLLWPLTSQRYRWLWVVGYAVDGDGVCHACIDFCVCVHTQWMVGVWMVVHVSGREQSIDIQQVWHHDKLHTFSDFENYELVHFSDILQYNKCSC